MKPLSHIEYQNRLQRINQAMALYGVEAKGNISVALEMMDKDATDIYLPAEMFNGRSGSVFDDYERPDCPECGCDMGFRPVPHNDDGVITQLVCLNPECDIVIDSPLTITEWLNMLEKKDNG